MPFNVEMPDGTVIQDVPDGTTKAQLEAKYKSHIGTADPSSLVDAARTLPGGLAKGLAAVAGLPGDVGALEKQGVQWLGNKISPGAGDAVKGGLDAISVLPTSDKIKDTVSAPFGGFYEPKTTAGHYAEQAAEFAPLAMGGEGSLASRVLSRVLLPSAGSETAGRVAAGKSYEGVARIVGALAGASPVAAAAGLRRGARALAGNFSEKLPIEDQKLIAQYEAMGGNLRPGQYSPSNMVRQGDSVLSDTHFPRAAGFKAGTPTYAPPSQQVDQFNTLLSKEIGENAPRITDEVIQKAGERIGKVYDDVLPRNQIIADDPVLAGLTKTEATLAEAAPAMKREDVARVAATVKKIKDQLASGGITGKQYQVYRQRGGTLDELAGDSSPVLSNAGRELRETLDEAFARQAQGADGVALKTAREQFRKLQVIKALAAKAPTGNISPGLVLGAVNREFGSPAAAGDLGTLGRVGNAYLKALANSGTSERSVWRTIMNKPFSEGIPAVGNALVGMPFNFAASRAVNRTINSPGARARMLADVLQHGPPQKPNSAALASVMAKRP